MTSDLQNRVAERPFAWGFERRGGRSRRGSAALVVLILLALVTTLIVSNAVVLRRLRVELQLLEEKQKRALEERWQPGAAQPP